MGKMIDGLIGRNERLNLLSIWSAPPLVLNNELVDVSTEPPCNGGTMLLYYG